jgi:hypothetical protein
MDREQLGSEGNPKGMSKQEELELERTVQQQLEDAEARAAAAKTPTERKRRMANVYYWRKKVRVKSVRGGRPKVRVGKPEVEGHRMVLPIFIELPLHLKVVPIMECEVGNGKVEE